MCIRDSSVTAPGSVQFNSPQHLKSLEVNAGATATLGVGGDNTLVAKTVNINGGALDLTDNGMVITAMSYDAVEALVKSGFGNYDCSGTGINSSIAATSAQS